MPRKKGFTVHQVIAMLEVDDDFTCAFIFITPPADANCSDEGSGDEDGGIVNNLTHRQREADAMATVKRDQQRFYLNGNDESEPASALGETIIKSSPTRFSVADGNGAGTVTKSKASDEDPSSTLPLVASRRRRSKTSTPSSASTATTFQLTVDDSDVSFLQLKRKKDDSVDRK